MRNKHLATNQGGSVTDNGEFDSGQIDPGKTWSHTFDTAGTFGYHCTIHPFMAGTVVAE